MCTCLAVVVVVVVPQTDLLHLSQVQLCVAAGSSRRSVETGAADVTRGPDECHRGLFRQNKMQGI